MTLKNILLYALIAIGILSGSVNLQTITDYFRKAQIHLLQESKASNWGHAWTLKNR